MKWEVGTAVSLNNIHTLSSEDIALQFKVSQIHRLAWFGLIALIVAAILGMFGGSYTLESDARPITNGIDYPYLVRHASPFNWTLKTKNAREIWVSSSLARAVDFEKVLPAPQSVRTVEDKVLLTFARAPEQINFRVNSKALGFIQGKIGSELSAFSVGFFAIP